MFLVNQFFSISTNQFNYISVECAERSQVQVFVSDVDEIERNAEHVHQQYGIFSYWYVQYSRVVQ